MQQGRSRRVAEDAGLQISWHSLVDMAHLLPQQMTAMTHLRKSSILHFEEVSAFAFACRSELDFRGDDSTQNIQSSCQMLRDSLSQNCLHS